MAAECCRQGKIPSLLSRSLQSLTNARHDAQLVAAIFKSCAAQRAIGVGKALHASVAKLGIFSYPIVSKALLNIYAKCGAVEDCRKLFAQLDKSDPVVWNVVFTGLSSFRVYDVELVGLFNQMHAASAAKPNLVTLAVLLPVYARLGDPNGGKTVHAYSVKAGLERQTLVGNALVSMYAKCGLVKKDGYFAFDGIIEKDVVSFNSMIAGFLGNRDIDEAFRLFRKMLDFKVEPDSVSVVNILPACASWDKTIGYRFGKEIHCHVLRRGELGEDVSVFNSLVSFYLKVGRIEEGESVFRRMQKRDLVSWNAVIAGYTLNNKYVKALHLFRELLFRELQSPDSVTLLSVIAACGELQNLQAGKAIHGYNFRHCNLYNDAAVTNALIAFYTKCKQIEAAYLTFRSGAFTDLISWNSILDAFAGKGCETRFKVLLREMLGEGFRPDSVTILAIIQFCTASKLDLVKETHGYAVRGCILPGNAEPTVGNALLDAYAKCGNMKYALGIFHDLSEKRNLITYNTMVACYLQNQLLDDAAAMFHLMPEKDLTTCNLMLRLYTEENTPAQATGLLHALQGQDLKPDAVTVMTLLPICIQMASVHMLRQCHSYVIRACFDDVQLDGALIDAYAKCGSISDALSLFESNSGKDLFMFTSMVGGYAFHGMGEEALMLFSSMLDLGLKPDHVIVTALLSACSHAGLVDEGLQMFHSLQKSNGIRPTMEQYACVVDLLARAGRVQDAYSFVSTMPVEATANIWGTLLGACRNHRDLELGHIVARRLFEIEANSIGNYVTMSNLYAADAKWDGVLEMRRLMRSRDLKKPAGCSWIEVGRKNNVFIAGDCSHPRRGIVYDTLHSLDQQIKDLILSN